MDKYEETHLSWDKVAQPYQDKFMYLNLYDHSYFKFLALIPPSNCSVLEIGCGPGNITKFLLNINPNLNILGIDISDKMIKLAQQNNPNVLFKKLDARSIQSIKQQFNAIIGGFCIPYLSKNDVSKLILDCYELLEKDGILYLSFIDGQDLQSGYISGSTGDRMYFYYHPIERIIDTLEDNNFIIVEQFDINYKKSDKTDEKHTILIAQKL